MYKLIFEKHPTKYVLGRGDVVHRLRVLGEVIDELLVVVRLLDGRVTWLHGAEIVPGLELGGGQRDGRAATNALEGDLPSAEGDVLQTELQGLAPHIHRCSGIVRHQVEILQPGGQSF